MVDDVLTNAKHVTSWPVLASLLIGQRKSGQRRSSARGHRGNDHDSDRSAGDLLAGLLAISLALSPLTRARAQAAYPSRPVHLVIGFPPGAAADITARVLGNGLGQILGQQFVVENKPGAGSSVAADYAAYAANDGYTLFLGSSANITNQAINPNAVRHEQGFCADRSRRHRGRRSGGQSGNERALGRGTDCARQVEARRGALRFDRRRRSAASCSRTVCPARRRHTGACAVPRHPQAVADLSPAAP